MFLRQKIYGFYSELYQVNGFLQRTLLLRSMKKKKPYNVFTKEQTNFTV